MRRKSLSHSDPSKRNKEYVQAPSRAQEHDPNASGYEVPYQQDEGKVGSVEVPSGRRSTTYGTYGNFDSFDRNVSGSRYSPNTDGGAYAELEKYSDYAHLVQEKKATPTKGGERRDSSVLQSSEALGDINDDAGDPNHT